MFRKTLPVQFSPRDIQTADGRVLSVSCGTPSPMHAIHLRVGQHLLLRSDEDYALWPYVDIRNMLAMPEAAEDLDPLLLSALREWTQAVERAAPYTITELAYDVSAERLCTLLGIGLAGLAARQRGNTKWPVSDLYVLKMQFPSLDLEATCREIYLRERMADQIKEEKNAAR